MEVRAYTDADFESLRAMHAAQGFGYAFPDLADPLFLVRSVVEEDGRPRMAAFLRLTAEAYLLADPREGSPRQRWRWLLALHEAVRQRGRGARPCRRAGVFAAARGACIRAAAGGARLAPRSVDVLHAAGVKDAHENAADIKRRAATAGVEKGPTRNFFNARVPARGHVWGTRKTGKANSSSRA